MRQSRSSADSADKPFCCKSERQPCGITCCVYLCLVCLSLSILSTAETFYYHQSLTEQFCQSIKTQQVNGLAFFFFLNKIKNKQEEGQNFNLKCNKLYMPTGKK